MLRGRPWTARLPSMNFDDPFWFLHPPPDADPWLHRLQNEMWCKNVTTSETFVLANLWRCYDQGETKPSRARLADLARVSQRTVSLARTKGRTLGLLTREYLPAVTSHVTLQDPTIPAG